jgi:acetyl esterase
MVALLARLAQARSGQPNRYLLPFPQARAQLLAERLPWLDDGPSCDLQRRSLPTAGGSVDVQVVRPPGVDQAGTALLIYLHGGGWCVGSARTHEPIVRRLAVALQCVAWSVDYRLAPEHPFPAGLLDCVAVIEQAGREHPGAKLIVAGDSAGANLAMAAAMWLRERRKTVATAGVSSVAVPDALLLFYGVYTQVIEGPSMAAYGDGRYGLSVAAHQRYMQAYQSQAGPNGSHALQPDQRYALELSAGADLAGLPPAFLVAAQIDILRDQTLAMCQALRAAGNETDLLEVPGVIHGFLSYGKVLGEVGEVISRAAAFVHRQRPLNGRPTTG